MGLLPREGRFFDLFNSHAELAARAAVELKALFTDLSELEPRSRAIERNEKEADRITHETVQLLHKTFITPLDRDEIHQLITGMDDILDLMEDVATCVFLYDVRAVTPDAQKLAEICVACTLKVKEAVGMLASMDNADAILRICGDIDRLESEADFVFRSALAKLFREESDAKQILKLKEVYQLLESITDKARGRRQRDRGHRARERLTGPAERRAVSAATMSFEVVVFLIVLALAFDFMNGFHDAANSIATVVSTRVLRPHYAVAWAAFFNFIAFLFFGLNVANTIGTGVIDPGARRRQRDPRCADRRDRLERRSPGGTGCPSSSSHALIGGLAGAAVAKGGVHSLVGSGFLKISLAIVLSPVLGFTLGVLLMTAVAWMFSGRAPHRVDRWFRRLQLVSASLYSLGHGGNDAQKTMGIIALILVAHGSLEPDFHGADIPFWVVLACQAAIALGTLFGGWRIVKTMGQKITKLKPVGGFCAETGGAMTLFLATGLGIPVSTTHTITGAIIGVGATRKLSAVRWGVAGRIVWAWVLTIPCTGFISMVAWWLAEPLPVWRGSAPWAW